MIDRISFSSRSFGIPNEHEWKSQEVLEWIEFKEGKQIDYFRMSVTEFERCLAFHFPDFKYLIGLDTTLIKVISPLHTLCLRVMRDQTFYKR